MSEMEMTAEKKENEKTPIRISLGFVNCYAIPARDGHILVDAGAAGMGKKLFGEMERCGVDPAKILLIVVTHSHGDHAGCLKAVQERSGAPVMAHRVEADFLERGEGVEVVGVGAVGNFMSFMLRMFPNNARFAPCEVERVVDDEVSLAEFGVAGRVVHTPGHTPGSLSILLDGGDAVVGDNCFDFYPFGLGPIFPPIVCDVRALLESWRMMLEADVKRVHAGHGPPFDAGRLRAKYEEKTG